MLKDLLKNSGLLVILAGVIVLGVVVFTKVQTNAHLSLSLGLIIVGLLAHIVINKMVD
jgi:riboflavin synthase